MLDGAPNEKPPLASEEEEAEEAGCEEEDEVAPKVNGETEVDGMEEAVDAEANAGVDVPKEKVAAAGNDGAVEEDEDAPNMNVGTAAAVDVPARADDEAVSAEDDAILEAPKVKGGIVGAVVFFSGCLDSVVLVLLLPNENGVIAEEEAVDSVAAADDEKGVNVNGAEAAPPKLNVGLNDAAATFASSSSSSPPPPSAAASSSHVV